MGKADTKWIPRPPGYRRGVHLSWGSVSTITVGTAGEYSSVRSVGDTFDLEFSGVKTADMATVGAGGLQTGSAEAASTWYEVHVIGDSTGVNAVNALLIPVGTAFAETGYDENRRVGYTRNNGSSDFLKFNQTGSLIIYDENVGALLALSGGAATAWTDVPLASFVPPTSQQVVALLGYDTAAASDIARIRQKGSTTPTGPVYFRIGAVVSGALTLMWSSIFTDANQDIQYRVTNASSALDIAVIGYRDEI